MTYLPGQNWTPFALKEQYGDNKAENFGPTVQM